MNADNIAFILPEKPILKKVLQIILAELGASKDGEVRVDYNKIRYLFQNKQDFLSMLLDLEEMDLVKVKGTANNALGLDSKGSRESLFMTLRAYMSFENSTHLILDINKKKILEVISKEVDQRPVDTNYTFTLTKDALLHRTINGTRQSYQMDKNSIPYQILKILAENKDELLNSADLQKQTGANSTKTITDAIGEFRRKISENFKGVNPRDFLPEGIRGSGYGLGKNIQIISE